jgi:hypothetical protein
MSTSALFSFVQASILAALGFTYHMKGNLEQAIESYHTVSSCTTTFIVNEDLTFPIIRAWCRH